jgi:hypothetical protein
VKNFFVLLLGFLLTGSALGGTQQGDSVSSSVRRGAWGAPLTTASSEKVEYFPLFDKVSLWFPAYGLVPYRFGPYRNSSPHALQVAVERMSGDTSYWITGGVDDERVASHPHLIELQVGPGSKYFFETTGPSRISVRASRPNLSPGDVGMPEAKEFVYPRGDFYDCLAVERPLEPDSAVDRMYFYRRGTMSNGSNVVEEFAAPFTGLTIGPKPYEHDDVCSNFK